MMALLQAKKRSNNNSPIVDDDIKEGYISGVTPGMYDQSMNVSENHISNQYDDEDDEEGDDIDFYGEEDQP